MKIECISQPPRPGGTRLSLPVAGTATLEKAYHFRNPGLDTPGLTAERIKQLADEAPHIAEVADPAHVKMLLDGCPEAFREYREPLTPEEEAIEIERLRVEAAEKAEADAKAEAERLRAAQAEIDRQIAYEESLAQAARDLRDGRITAAEAEAIRAGIAPAPTPEPPVSTSTLLEPLRQQQLADEEAKQKAALKAAEEARNKPDMTVAEARAIYKQRLQKNPSPGWDADTVLKKLAEAEAKAEG